MDFNDKMANLIESIGDVDIDKLQCHQKQINEIADYCKDTGLYKQSERKRNAFSNGMNAVECYQQMIFKVIEAPNQMMARAAALLIIPIIADKLNDA